MTNLFVCFINDSLKREENDRDEAVKNHDL